MKRFISHLCILMTAVVMMACQSDEANAMPPVNNNSSDGDTKTLVVYYSYTNNSRDIVTTLTSQISADVLETQPAEKGLHYEANGYALGTQLLNAIKANPDDASSYPAIETSPVLSQGEGLEKYSTIIIVTPLWWSQMAAIMQSYLFSYGSQMAGKNIGLIVSSASSGISGVVTDCKRLVPDGKYFSQNLWINDSNRSRRSSLIQDWLNAINYNSITAINEVKSSKKASANIYSLNGQKVAQAHKGIYIVNGEKKVIE